MWSLKERCHGENPICFVTRILNDLISCGIVPYIMGEIPEILLFVFRTNGYKIRTIATVIIIFKAKLFSYCVFHKNLIKNKTPLKPQNGSRDDKNRGSTLIHTKKASYLIGSVTGATGAYWAHSEAVCCIFLFLQSRTKRLLSEKNNGKAFLVIDF